MKYPITKAIALVSFVLAGIVYETAPKVVVLAALLTFHTILYRHRQSRLLRRAVDEFGVLLTFNQAQHQTMLEQNELIDAMYERLRWLTPETDTADVERFSATVLEAYGAGEGSPVIKGYTVYTLARCPFSDN